MLLPFRFCQLCTLRHPFDAANQGALILKIIRGRYPPLPAVYAATKLQRVLDALLRKDTALRPTITQVLASASVYSKARALGIPMPPDVEALVESRKQAPPPHLRPAGGRTQPLEGAHVVASPPAPELVPPPARGALARTARKARVRMGASTVGSGAAALPVICGAAPARPTPHGRVLPGRGKPAAVGGKKPRALGAGASYGGVQSVRDLPDVVPGALLAAGPPPPLHAHQPGSFIPSPEADSSDSLSFPAAHAASAAMGHAPSAAVAAKPSVSAFKHALGNASLAHEFGVSPLSSSRSTASAVADSSGSSTAARASPHGHGASSAAATPRDADHEDDGVDSDSYEDDAHDAHNDSSSSVLPTGDLSEDEYIAATLAQLELDEHGGGMDADLVDTSHDGDEDGVLSGSADEVQWRIIEGGAHDDQHDGAEHESEEPQLYDDDEESSAFAVDEHKQPDNTGVSNPPPPLRAHSTALDASQPFGLGSHPDESHAHNSTAQFVSAIGHGHGHSHSHPHSHPHPDASQVFHAVQERAHKLRAQIAALVTQVEEMVGRASFAKLYEYFKVQAASGESGGSSGGGGVTASSSPSAVSASAEHEFVLSLVRVEDMDACITKIYQLLYLEEEADKCTHILQLAAAAAKIDGQASAAQATSHALNMTPRPAVPSTPSALLATSNLTLKRQALLHPRSRVATASAAMPPAAAVRNKPQRAQPTHNALPPAGNQSSLSHTLAPAPGRPVPVRQRRPGGSGAGARVI